ncbi:MAG: MFS transporter [Proteobacteria bacterium]|nr:MFS transporter [Pseudomonadota bacterium]
MSSPASFKEKPAPPTTHTTLSKAAWLTLMAAFLGWLLDGFELGLFPVVARPALQSLLGPGLEGGVGLWMGRITAAFLLGAALGGVVFGWLGDKIGRVKAMAWSILCYSIFSGAGYFAEAPWHLALFRFIAALGMGGEWALGVALVMETWPDKHRPWLAAAIGAAANVGMALVGVVARIFVVTPDSWRWLFLVGAAPAVLTLIIRIWVPESEKWKASTKDETNESKVATVLRPPLLTITLIGIFLSAVALIGSWGSVQWIPSWADQLTGGTRPDAKATVQIVSSLGAALGAILGPVFLARLSRRLAYGILSALALTFSVWLFRFPAEWGTLFLVKTGLIAVTTASFYGFFPLYFPELFPTSVRATGQGICYNFGRIIAAFGALGSGQLVAQLGGYAQMGAVVTLVYVLGIALAFIAPETKGRPLPD